MTSASNKIGMLHVVTALAAVAMAAALARTILHLPTESLGLTALVGANMPQSGVEHPVTAVLLNFRGYDTWLEVGVLWMAALGMLLFQPNMDLRAIHRMADPELVLDWLIKLIFPMMVLASGYLVWIGKYSSGGAFQAGVVLGAAAVLIWLAGHRSITGFPNLLFRFLLIAGFLCFMLVGGIMILQGRNLLEFPLAWAGHLILLIEATATISIALTVSALIIGLQPHSAPAKDTQP